MSSKIPSPPQGAESGGAREGSLDGPIAPNSPLTPSNLPPEMLRPVSQVDARQVARSVQWRGEDMLLLLPLNLDIVSRGIGASVF
jgi:hypothetical protein